MRYTPIKSVIETYRFLTAKSDNALTTVVIGDAIEEYLELRRLVALLTAELLRITRADIDSAKRILQKAEE